MTIRLNDERRPLGYHTWVAYLRDGSIIQEFFSEQNANGDWIDYPQKSFDLIATRDDVAWVYLIPIDDARRSSIRIDVADGERVVKKFTRTFSLNLDTSDQTEAPIIECFELISDKPMWHYAYHDGSMLITTAVEP